MNFKALYKNVIFRRWCVCVCVFCRKGWGDKLHSWAQSSRVRGWSKLPLPFRVSFFQLLPNSQVFLFFLSNWSGHYSRGKNQMFVNQRPPILDSINKYLLKHLRCLLFHEFSRFLFLIFSFSAGYERRSSSAQINRESKKGKIWQNMGKTCCKIVENSCFKCFIGLVTLLSTGALVSESM